jgi:translation initiation factor 1
MDPFPDFNKATDVFDVAKNTTKIHIRVQQMGKRWITTIEGLDEDLDLKRISRGMKKSFHCSVKISTNKDQEEVIQLQGDQRECIKEWLVVNEVITKKDAEDRLMIHGA